MNCLVTVSAKPETVGLVFWTYSDFSMYFDCTYDCLKRLSAECLSCGCCGGFVKRVSGNKKDGVIKDEFVGNPWRTMDRAKCEGQQQ